MGSDKSLVEDLKKKLGGHGRVSLSMALELRKIWSQLWMNVLFQPSSHLAQEDWVRAKSHTDVHHERAEAVNRLRKVERADLVEIHDGRELQEKPGERTG